MRRLESYEDYMRNVVTYELDNGERICMDARAVRELGANEILRQYGYGHLLPTDRQPVFHCGEMIGTVPPDFDPPMIQSRSFLYDPRPGDFTRTDKGWNAARNLGGGDFAMIPGFVPA